MLSLTIFLPLITALFILAIPSWKGRWIRGVALTGSVATLGLTFLLLSGFDPSLSDLQWRITLPWISAINASYDVAVDGISLPLILLTAVLLSACMLYVLPQVDRQPKMHAFFFLVMGTGLIGLFAAQDLLLFYLFFEVALVPMYFIIGMWGHENRRYAAMKFFLYTRAGSLAMLLSFLALYLNAEPHTFSLPELIAQQPMADAGRAGGLVLLGMLIGFGVKLPVVPIHNWLPDAHVEAPTEGSVMLAGIQLKMGAYGLLRVMLPTMQETAAQWGMVLLVLGVVALVYGALAALGQSDLKRMIAYTSINHMGYVMLGAAAWALSTSLDVRQLALNGAVYQIVSHGLLTGGMFFMVGMLQKRAGTREISRFGGLMRAAPVFAFVLGLLAFGSLGLPGFSGFIAEFQVIGATVSVSFWAAVLTVIGLLITTGLYLRIIVNVIFGEVTAELAGAGELTPREMIAVGMLALLSLELGLFPSLLIPIIDSATQVLAGLGL